ncbi:MAG TPA: phosphatase PAP2 family protein [Conexibacter sp.]|nr:phosphatase PAP2 family protein [Conexibacter sp.]
MAICVALPRTRARDAAACALQMWAYLAAYEMPNDDPEALRKRVRIDYPVQVDRVLGLGVPPTLRLQRMLRPPGEMRRVEKLLVWTHWVWFAVPHAATLYVLIRERERFGHAAATTYAVFDLGALVYHLLPTAPPWYAAERGRLGDARTPPVRRMMVEYGEQFWKHRWGPLYSVLGGNPLAAMPSLHFATSVNAAHLLAESGPVEGALGWAYALTLGVALVYLGEHYVVDLLAGLALTESVRALAPAVGPPLERAARVVQAIEARAHP